MKRERRVRTAAYWKIAIKKELIGLLFLLPLICGIAVFSVYPILQSLYYSFFKYDMMNTFEFVGLDNYIRIFTVDFKDVSKSMYITLLYTVISIPINLTLSYSLALLLNKKTKNINVFRLLIYAPVIIPPIASSLLWVDIFSYDGIINRFLNILGIGSLNWLKSEDTALFTMIVMNLWGLGGGMILWLSAFKNIPETLYEAARIDGAGRARIIFGITVPLTTPMIFYNLLTAIIGSLQMFSSYLIASDTNGRGPNDSLYFYCVRIFNEAFSKFNMGYASALAWILFLVIGVLTVIMFKTGGWVQFGEDN